MDRQSCESLFRQWNIWRAENRLDKRSVLWWNVFQKLTVYHPPQQITEWYVLDEHHPLSWDQVATVIRRLWNSDVEQITKTGFDWDSIRNELKAFKVNPDLPWKFITIGYDDKKITVANMRIAAQKVFALRKAEYSFFRYTHEKFRKDDNGKIYEHHHTHFLVKTKLSKSKIIDLIYKTCIKNYICSKNFIDVKQQCDRVGTFEQKLDYINGVKQDSKMNCVEMDRKWRLENDLDEIVFL